MAIVNFLDERGHPEQNLNEGLLYYTEIDTSNWNSSRLSKKKDDGCVQRALFVKIEELEQYGWVIVNNSKGFLILLNRTERILLSEGSEINFKDPVSNRVFTNEEKETFKEAIFSKLLALQT